ncbi:MAG: transporter [Pseudolabrys sp.]|nr:transporter [Pseudolabrys sp.]
MRKGIAARWLRATGAVALFSAALLAAATSAKAGGFAIREQSAYGQGTSFAGIAAGGSLSAMFWNPAVMTQFAGIESEASATWIIPHAGQTASPGSSFFGIFPGTLDNSSEQALVPSGYFSYQLNPNLWVGLSITSPFGLAVSFPDLWAGRDYAAGDTWLRSYNFTPSIAWRINDWISIGAGVQIQYATTSLTRGISLFPLFAGDVTLAGNGWGYGFTAGVTLTPTPTTTIGVGYRSFVDQKIDGSLNEVVPPVINLTLPAGTTLRLPDMVSLGIRQRIDPQLTLLGTVEWTNWSRIGTADVVSNGATIATLPFQYRDGWLFALGAEYQWSDRLTLRGGLAYEISPITDAVRIPLLPDNDRVWLSVGLSWQIWKGFSADLAYSHIFVRDTHIDISAASGNPWFTTLLPVTYIGDVDSHVDILSLSLKYRWDEPKAPARTGLITK